MATVWLPATLIFWCYNWNSSWSRWCTVHFFWFFMFEYPMIWMVIAGQLVGVLLGVSRGENRLKNGKLLGKKVLVIGNGPSAKESKVGDVIDSCFDEVIRFNNFSNKGSLAEYAGTKTTVHFSDAMLYPSWPEYKVPGAVEMLAQFDERLMTAGSYLLFRVIADWEPRAAWKFLSDPKVWWIPGPEIAQVKIDVGNTHPTHPTSGMLAINHFMKLTDEPIYIHGFDFFQGPVIHYYDEVEPFYERMNDKIGVNMHQPKKEKKLVEKLIEQGKVRVLKDYAEELRKSAPKGK